MFSWVGNDPWTASLVPTSSVETTTSAPAPSWEAEIPEMPSPPLTAQEASAEPIKPASLLSSIKYEVSRRTDGSKEPRNALPQHLLEQARKFPKLNDFDHLSPLAQANILILQLAGRVQKLEDRLQALEARQSDLDRRPEHPDTAYVDSATAVTAPVSRSREHMLHC